jgi:hypothetical protein
MKRILHLIAVISASFLLTACPYESEVPIDKPSVKFPATLFGKWEPKSSSDDILTIQRKNDFVVTIIKTKKDAKPDDSVDKYEAFISEVGNLKFLNVSELSEYSSGTKYYLYKMEVSPSGSRITLSSVTENIDEKFSSSAELKAFVQKNMQLSFFFEKEEEVYLRLD